MRHQRWMIVLMVVIGGMGLLLALPRGVAAKGEPTFEVEKAAVMPMWEWRWEARWNFNGSTDGRLLILARDRNNPALDPLTATLRIGCTSQGGGTVTTTQGRGVFPGDAYLNCTMPDMAAAVDQLTGGQAAPDPLEGYDRFWMQTQGVNCCPCLTCTFALESSPSQVPLLSMQGFEGGMQARAGQFRIVTRIGASVNRSHSFGPEADGSVSWLADHAYVPAMGWCGARFFAVGKRQGRNFYGCPAPGDAVVLRTDQQTVLIGNAPGAPQYFEGTIDDLRIDPPNWSVIGGQ